MGVDIHVGSLYHSPSNVARAGALVRRRPVYRVEGWSLRFDGRMAAKRPKEKDRKSLNGLRPISH